MLTTKYLDDEELATVNLVLKLADELATKVIIGAPGTSAKALEYARAIDTLKRKKIVSNR